jgi:hypothetical protein
LSFQYGTEGSVRGGFEGSKVKHMLTDDAKRTCRGIAGGAVTDGFASDTAFMGGEIEGVADAGKWGCSCVEGGVAKREGDVTQMEGMGFGVGAPLTILPGAEKEEESHDSQIGDGVLPGGSSGELGDGLLDVVEELERHWSHAGRRRVFLAVASELSSETEVGAAGSVVPRVRGPHAGEYLGHGAKVLLRGPLANGLAAGGKLARADAMSKHLEEGDWVVDPIEGGVEPQLGAEGAPLSPIGPVSGGLLRMDPSGNLVLAKAVDSPCCCLDVRCSICQDVACGKER